ncbi:MAG: cytochrome b/b6 domain-containing protein [Sphingomonadales bacterium]|nr:cytochrome b/b6 domain-containing protein [Sphingomonadales bacterium]
MSTSYTRGQKILHWLLAVMLLFWLFVSGNLVEAAEGEEKGMILMFHSGGAIVILGLMLWRLRMRLRNTVAPMAELKVWEQTWSVRLHWAFYGLVCLMVLSGILQGMFFEQDVRVFGVVNITLGHNEGLMTLFHNIHGLTANLLKAGIALHILAALKHQLVDRIAFLKRMT